MAHCYQGLNHNVYTSNYGNGSNHGNGDYKYEYNLYTDNHEPDHYEHDHNEPYTGPSEPNFYEYEYDHMGPGEHGHNKNEYRPGELEYEQSRTDQVSYEHREIENNENRVNKHEGLEYEGDEILNNKAYEDGEIKRAEVEGCEHGEPEYGGMGGYRTDECKRLKTGNDKV